MMTRTCLLSPIARQQEQQRPQRRRALQLVRLLTARQQQLLVLGTTWSPASSLGR
jgi:hypothetical protein